MDTNTLKQALQSWRARILPVCNSGRTRTDAEAAEIVIQFIRDYPQSNDLSELSLAKLTLYLNCLFQLMDSLLNEDGKTSQPPAALPAHTPANEADVSAMEEQNIYLTDEVDERRVVNDIRTACRKNHGRIPKSYAWYGLYKAFVDLDWTPVGNYDLKAFCAGMNQLFEEDFRQHRIKPCTYSSVAHGAETSYNQTKQYTINRVTSFFFNHFGTNKSLYLKK